MRAAMREDELDALDRYEALTALTELKRRGVLDQTVSEPRHCAECFEGCSKCEVRR